MKATNSNSTLLWALLAVLALGCNAGSGPGKGGTLPDGGSVDGTGNGGGDGSGNSGATESHFFLPTADQVRNTAGARIATDAQGNVHMVYPAYSKGDAFYAVCAGNCSSENQVKSVRLPTDGTVYNAMVAIGSNGKPRLLLSTMQHIYYALCTGDCTQLSGWQMSSVLEIGGIREVSGDAFALTAQDGPRFVMHTYRAYFGVDQKPAATFYVGCDHDCSDAANWSAPQISNQIWQESSLKLDAQGHPHLGTVATVVNDDGSSVDMAAYIECNGTNCSTQADWNSAALVPAFSDRYTLSIDPAISLALDGKGGMRVATLGVSSSGGRNVTYAECSGACAEQGNWHGGAVSTNSQLDAGLDLKIGKNGETLLAYNLQGNLFLATCASGCTASNAPWKLGKIEAGADMKPDEIMPYPNCNVGAWFLRHPRMALGTDGLPRVSYQAMDVSGGWTNPDPTQSQCQAGLDMTWARYTEMAALP